MTSNSGARGFLSGRRGPLIGAVVVTALVVLVAFFVVWHVLGRDAWHEVRVEEARLIDPMSLELFIATCSAPRVSLWERDVDVQVSAMSVSGPSQGGVVCRISVEFDLLKPLGDRAIVDQHTGRVVNVTTAR